MSIRTDVALKKTLGEYCDARDKVREMYKHGCKALRDAESMMRESIPYGISGYAQPRDSESEVLRRIDAQFWRHALDLTKLSTIMDAKAMQQFRNELETDKMPEFTLESVQATFLDMYQSRDEMFGRGCWEVFRSIKPGRYVSNDKEPYKIPANARVILGFWFESNWSKGRRVNYSRTDTVNDVDRIFRVLDGKEPNPRGFESELNAFFAKHPDEMFENEYYRVRCFANGNAHIWFIREDLVDKLNKTIAEYCGPGLPDTSQHTHHRPRPTSDYEAGVRAGSL